MKLKIGKYKKIVILTGAGLSVASGLGPYRGPNGLWEKEELAKFTHVAMMYVDPAGMWKAFGPLRTAAVQSQPNVGHLTLSGLQEKIKPPHSLHIVTQNVDGFHAIAGSKNAIELHGNLRYSRCSNRDCTLPRFLDPEPHLENVPLCPKCNEFIRPDIVLFGEMLPERILNAATLAVQDCDLFIAIGTSGSVMPAARFVSAAKEEGAKTIYVNIEGTPNADFDFEILGKAEEILPTLFI